MKRDLDLIREILLIVEAAPAGEATYDQDFVDKVYDKATIREHFRLLEDAGFVKLKEKTHPSTGAKCLIITRMTWLGYDYLDSLRINEA